MSHVAPHRLAELVSGALGRGAAHRAQLEAHQTFRDFEMKRFEAGDDSVYISISGQPVYSAEGKFCGYRGIGRNI